MNVTKTEILKALDWFDENYSEAIDFENITEICTWMKTLNNMYGASLPLEQDAYYMAFIYILSNFPQNEIEKHREELGIFTYVLVSLKHGVKSFDFSNYSYGKPLSAANFLDIGRPKGYPTTTVTIDEITVDLSGDGANTLELLRYLPGKTLKIHTLILNQDPSRTYRRGLQQSIMVYGILPDGVVPVDTLIVNNFVGINFYAAPFSVNILKLNGTCELLDIKMSEKDRVTGNTNGINFNVLDLTGLKDDSITLSPSFQVDLSFKPGGSNTQIITRRNQKILVKKKFAEVLKPLFKKI